MSSNIIVEEYTKANADLILSIPCSPCAPPGVIPQFRARVTHEHCQVCPITN